MDTLINGVLERVIQGGTHDLCSAESGGLMALPLELEDGVLDVLGQGMATAEHAEFVQSLAARGH